MYNWRGNTSAAATTPIQVLPFVINNFSVVNKSGTSITVNISVITSNGTLNIAPYNLTLNIGEMYEEERPILVLSNEQIRITTTGSIDYYFNLNNTPPVEMDL